MKKEFPILEFDNEQNAVLNANDYIKPIDIPEHGILCFFNEVINKLKDDGKAKLIRNLRSEMGNHPVYEVEYSGRKVAVYQPGIAAPFAVALLEEVIALGCRKFIACGGAGVLNKDIAVGNIIVPYSAVRDEGTSYHYIPPSREVEASREAIKAIETVLNKYKFKYVLGKTWTTDAIFRETEDKVKLRKEEGCLTVEMECSAFFAVAEFRKLPFGQILYGGDDVSSEEWSYRGEVDRNKIRERLFWLAVESCLVL